MALRGTESSLQRSDLVCFLPRVRPEVGPGSAPCVAGVVALLLLPYSHTQAGRQCSRSQELFFKPLQQVKIVPPSLLRMLPPLIRPLAAAPVLSSPRGVVGEAPAPLHMDPGLATDNGGSGHVPFPCAGNQASREEEPARCCCPWLRPAPRGAQLQWEGAHESFPPAQGGQRRVTDVLRMDPPLGAPIRSHLTYSEIC